MIHLWLVGYNILKTIDNFIYFNKFIEYGRTFKAFKNKVMGSDLVHVPRMLFDIGHDGGVCWIKFIISMDDIWMEYDCVQDKTGYGENNWQTKRPKY